MAHEYFCTHCGRRLNQDTVLFDMQYVLTGTEKFDILTFRLNKAELDAVSAKAQVLDMNYRGYPLSFEEFLGYVSNERNLKKAEISGLTMDMIQEFLDQMEEDEYGSQEQADDSGQSGEADIFDIFNPPAEEIAPAVEKEVDKRAELDRWPEPIRAMMVMDERNTDYDATKKLMRSDFNKLKRLFANGSYRIEFFLNEMNDDRGGKVLTSYMAKVGDGEKRKVVTCEDARVCCHCSGTVFRYAGTAKHRTVALIGTQSSGKTSTILSLAHYAQNAATNVFADDPIWGKGRAKPLHSVLNIELISADQRLKDDLAKYQNGIAPDKTSASRRGDAYSATFRIQNSTDPSKYYIITLTDLPGELCKPEGLDRNNIMNEFQVALACEMFLLCFDAAATTGANANQLTHQVCNWANEFQELRSWFWENEKADRQDAAASAGCFAPVMILYTKCRELEDKNRRPNTGGYVPNPDPIVESYLFNRERVEIEKNPIYRHAGRQFQNFDRLANTYIARLRVSPYGYEAPGQEKVEAGEHYHHPEPVHVDDLMRWILAVNGCIDTGAVYYPDSGDHNTRFTQQNNPLMRPQYRKQSPGTDQAGKNMDITRGLNEALNRCYLFENPGVVDAAMVHAYDNLTERRTIVARVNGAWLLKPLYNS